MDEQKAKRIRRTPEQIAKDMDVKIQKLTEDLASLEEKRAAANADFDAKAAAIKERIELINQKKKHVLSPKTQRKHRKSKKQKIQELINNASKAGLKPEEIAERLGLETTEVSD